MKKTSGFASVVVCFLVSLALAAQALAQTPHSAIAGRVVDASGAVLQGAQVVVAAEGGAQPLDTTVASDRQGEFSLSNLAPGQYALVVTYVGFKTFQTEITLTAGDTNHVTAQMDVASQNEEVIVTAERPRGEAEAINRTRTADNILQVLPAEVITSLPNANVADALGRLPSVTLARDEGEGVYVQVRGAEPRLTNVTINGVSVPSPEPTVRSVRLDALPADLVESVEINKTLSANQDADGIGGSVNLRTKTASDLPTVIFEGLGGYNTILGGRGNDQFNLTLGKRFGSSKQLGLLVGASYDYNGRGIDDIEPAINPTLSTFASPFYDNNTVREYRYYRTRKGFGGSADYKLNDSSNFYVRGILSDLKDYGDKWYYSPTNTGTPKFYTSSKRPDYSIGSVNAGGRHMMRTSFFNWEVAVAHAGELDSAGNPKADFSWIGPNLTCGFSPAAQTNVFTPQFGNGCDAANTPLQNQANWGLKDLTVSNGSAAQTNVVVQASHTLNYHTGSHSASFEYGAKIRNGHKSEDASEIVYDGWKATAYPMGTLLDGFNSTNYYNGAYYGGQYGPVSNFNSVVNLVQSSLSTSVDGIKTASNTYPNQFDLTERIYAAYAMHTMDFNRLHVQAGVRVEATKMDVNGFNVVLYPGGSPNCTGSTASTGCGVPVPVNNSPSYTDVLPSVQARYAFTDNATLRAVYSRGLSRPDSYQLVPYATEDDSASPVAVSIGNPALKQSHANSYDLLYEHFLKPVGMIQAGVFYKSLSDPQAPTVYTPATGIYAGDMVSQWVNGSAAKLYGFELSYQQHMTYLPGALAGLGIFANYSRTGSRIDSLPGRTDSPALQRQSPTTWNISPTYDRGHVSLRVGLTYNGAAIYQYGYQTASDPSHLGPNGPSGDQYTYSHLQVDAQATVAITHSLKALVYGLNLNNEVYGLYVGSEQFVRQREYYHPTIAFGIRYVM